MTFAAWMPNLQLSVRAGVAAALSVAIAQALHLQPLQALITSVLVVDLSPKTTRQQALPRLAGTILGGAMGAALSQVLPPTPISIGLGILAAMFFSHLLRLGGSARLAGFLCGIVLLNYTDAPWSYAFHRLVETALGISLAVLTSFVPKLIRIGEENS